MTIGPPFTEEHDNLGAAIKAMYTLMLTMIMPTGMVVMTYGDGSGTYFDVLTSIDVAAHEIGHAVCENSKLSVPKESGAMKASLIFGSLYRILQHLENLLC
jgi:hypothetical protein